MEPIRIDIPYNNDDFIRSRSINWKLQSRKIHKQLPYYAIGSLIILGLGLLGRIDSKPMNSFIIGGIAFSIMTLLLFLFMMLAKHIYMKKIKSIAEKYNEIKMDCTYELTDESLKYWDKEKHIEYKWTVFSHYSLYKQYLILGINNSSSAAFIYEKKDSDGDIYDKIVDFIKTKVAYKEIR
jgi:hypothetical protein